MKYILIFLIFSSLSYASKLGNRYFLSNKLLSAFGPDSKEYILKNILNNGEVFSGPCDPYTTYRSKSKSYNILEDCYTGLHESKLQYWGKDSPIRVSKVNQTCKAISKNKRIHKYINLKRGEKRVDHYLIDILSPFIPIDHKNNIINKLRKNSSEQVIYKICKSRFWQYI